MKPHPTLIPYAELNYLSLPVSLCPWNAHQMSVLVQEPPCPSRHETTTFGTTETTSGSVSGASTSESVDEDVSRGPERVSTGSGSPDPIGIVRITFQRMQVTQQIRLHEKAGPLLTKDHLWVSMLLRVLPAMQKVVF